MRRRRLLPALAAAVALAVAPAGCGVPSESDVVVEGEGQEAAPAQGGEGTSEPPGRTASSDPQEFVRNFLVASAGSPELAGARVREFISPLARGDWKPPPVVNIVRLNADPLVSERADDIEVQVSVTHVGELGENGSVLPKPARSQQYKLVVDELNDDGLYVTEAPDVILLLDTALIRYYEMRTLYFWSADSTTLVPDLRYLPRRDVPTAQQPNQLIDWLLAGPSAWLRPAVVALPPDARRVDNVPATADNSLEVRLAKVVDTENESAINRLATQLRWSLREPSGRTERDLVLRIDQTPRVYDARDYLDANPAYRGGPDPTRLCIYDDGVHRLLPVPEGGRPVPELPADYDAQLLRVAMGRDGNRSVVAVVRAAANGRQALDLGAGEDVVLGEPRPSSLTAGSISQPVWLPGTPAVGLVAAGGALHTFRSGSDVVRRLPGSPEGVTAFAVPPDGRRLAYIAGGRLYVAPLLREENSVLLAGEDERRQLPTGLTGLSGVGWSQQTSLVVAGYEGDRLQFHDLTVDGALREVRTGQFGNAAVTHLVAATDDPGDGPAPGLVLYEVNGLSYELYNEQRRFTAADVAGAASPDPERDANPTAPFLLD